MLGLFDSIRVRRSMRDARFRPPLVDGKLVASEPQSFTYEYQYYAEPVRSEPLEAAPSKTTSKTSRDGSARNNERAKVKAGMGELSPATEQDAKKREPAELGKSSGETTTAPAARGPAIRDITMNWSPAKASA